MPRDILSADLRLAFDPHGMYADLAAMPARTSWRAALARPAFVALLFGTLVTIAATGRVTIIDVSLATLSWSFVPATQLLAGAGVIASVPQRELSWPRAIELFFAAHVPWSLWLLTVTAWVMLTRFGIETLYAQALSIVAPAIWTGVLVTAFCRSALKTSALGARVRAIVHQLVILAIMLTYAVWAAGIWPRVLEAMGR